MEHGFENRDFEHFVKSNADQYRMFPTEKVWSGIYNTLHTRRKWYKLGVALLLITSVIVTGVMFTNPAPTKTPIAAVSRQIASELFELVPKEQIVPMVKIQENQHQLVSPAEKYLNQHNLLIDEPSFNEKDIAVHFTPLVPSAVSASSFYKDVTFEQPDTRLISRNITKRPVTVPARRELVINEIISNTTPVSEQAIAGPEEEKAKTTVYKDLFSKNDSYPLTIESVLNSYTSRKKRLTWQVYVVPTISYRKLKENKNAMRSNQYAAGINVFNWVNDINSAVTHKPDLGFVTGVKAGYPLSKKLNLTAGFQINVSKYDIRALNTPNEVAVIALSGAAGRNSVSTVSNYRNYLGGSRSNWLKNLYVSASIPIGAEMSFNAKKKSYFGFGGSVQPTYILANRAYLLSSDYKNYAEVPSLTRRWNVNTSLEIFAGTTTGKLKWRVGPQVRYQVLSSFVEKYPIKEHLFDFGLKLGVIIQ